MEDRTLLQQIDTFISKNEGALVADLARLVAIRSVKEAPAGPGKPYGQGPRAALDLALEMARGFGLDTFDCDGHAGWAELPGAEEGHIATVTHVDVVPEGEGWDAPPTQLVQRDGWLIGRGVVDDKGPSILCLYAAKFLKTQNIPLRYGLRFIFGCNEENGMSDIDYYLERQPQPLFAFSPDSDFPLCNGEKGIFQGRFTFSGMGDTFAQFNAGLATNVIPGKASCLLNRSPAGLPHAAGVTVGNVDGKALLTAEGIGGHAAHPAGTKNAIGLLVAYLLENDLVAGAEKDWFQLLAGLHASSEGGGLGLDCADAMFGPLTLNGGVVQLAGGAMTQSIDIRYPTTTNSRELAEKLAAAAKAHGAGFTLELNADPFYIPADSAPIKTLLDTYNEVTGQSAGPFTMGGGTYARHFERAVSYGPVFPGTELPAFAGPEHAANEGAQLAGLLKALKIYILAICRLQKVDF